MLQESLRALIRRKLADGALSYRRTPQVWAGPGHDEVCGACDIAIANEHFAIETPPTADGVPVVHFHVRCFHLWVDEQRYADASSS
jgi:hypothetical protein